MLEQLLDILRKDHGLLAYALALGAAFSEYLVPVFPGDTVALFAVFLAAQAELSAVAVYVALTVGATAGGMAVWALGFVLAEREDQWPAFLRHPRVQRALSTVRMGFAKHGPAYLLINRFAPAFRAFFFLAAGLSRMHPLTVLIYGGISAAVWNLLLLSIGYGVGEHWDTLQSLVRQYTLVAFVAVAVVLLGLWLRARRR